MKMESTTIGKKLNPMERCRLEEEMDCLLLEGEHFQYWARYTWFSECMKYHRHDQPYPSLRFEDLVCILFRWYPLQNRIQSLSWWIQTHRKEMVEMLEMSRSYWFWQYLVGVCALEWVSQEILIGLQSSASSSSEPITLRLYESIVESCVQNNKTQKYGEKLATYVPYN